MVVFMEKHKMEGDMQYVTGPVSVKARVGVTSNFTLRTGVALIYHLT